MRNNPQTCWDFKVSFECCDDHSASNARDFQVFYLAQLIVKPRGSIKRGLRHSIFSSSLSLFLALSLYSICIASIVMSYNCPILVTLLASQIFNLHFKLWAKIASAEHEHKQKNSLNFMPHPSATHTHLQKDTRYMAQSISASEMGPSIFNAHQTAGAITEPVPERHTKIKEEQRDNGSSRDRQTGRRTGRQTDSWADEQTDGQTSGGSGNLIKCTLSCFFATASPSYFISLLEELLEILKKGNKNIIYNLNNIFINIF